jgi:hypothetical protein
MKFCYVNTVSRTNQQYALSAKGKQWAVGDEINIYFMNGTAKQQAFVRRTAEEWLQHANLKFNWVKSAKTSEVRISFLPAGGSWSYVGTDALLASRREATMNFAWLDKGVVLHEFGHMLGLKHEHQNPDGGIQWNEKAVIASLSGPPNNWDLPTIRRNVLEQAHPHHVDGTKFDIHSVMLYPFPKEWTFNTQGTPSNDNLSETDKQHIRKLYPPTTTRRRKLFGIF